MRRQLSATGLITQAELDAAQLAAKQAAAALTAANANVRAARPACEWRRSTRSRTIIRAPMDGIVVSRNVEVGQTVAASFSSPVLFRIANLSHMQLLAEIGEAEAGEIKAGVPVTFQIESLGPRTFKGVVSELRLEPVYETAGTSGSSGGAQAPTATSTTGNSTSSSSSQTHWRAHRRQAATAPAAQRQPSPLAR